MFFGVASCRILIVVLNSLTRSLMAFNLRRAFCSLLVGISIFPRASFIMSHVEDVLPSSVFECRRLQYMKTSCRCQRSLCWVGNRRTADRSIRILFLNKVHPGEVFFGKCYIVPNELCAKMDGVKTGGRVKWKVGADNLERYLFGLK